MEEKEIKKAEKDSAETNEKFETNSKYLPGNYTCTGLPVQVIKKLSAENKMNSDGKTVARTYATWTKDTNFIKFTPGQKTVLVEEDMKNPSIRNLIDNGKIIRVL